MKKSIFVIFFIMLITMFMPNRVNAATTHEFDYSKIKPLNNEVPKFYELDSSIGEILNQEWTLADGSPMAGTFNVNEKYKYVAEIKPNNPEDFFEVKNFVMLSDSSINVGRLGEDTVIIEIITGIPKEFNITINLSNGLFINGYDDTDTCNFSVLEMEEFLCDVIVSEDYEIVSATANGNAIFNNDAYFDDTFAHIFENKLKVWNINTDIEIFINAEKIKPILNVDLSVNEVFEGDSIEDVEFKFDCADFVVKEMQFAVEKEDELEEFIGTFEADKKYLVVVFFDVNNLDALEEQYSYVIIKHNNQELEVDIDNNGFYVICELDIKEKTTTDIEEKPIINSGEKDNSPKTGVNFSVIYVILGMATLGVIGTSKRK